MNVDVGINWEKKVMEQARNEIKQGRICVHIQTYSMINSTTKYKT